ncbi:hypothetical protein [Nocardia asteroides]|uniref:hypothetical protein n=1 Tax=Nocardia asteroides TaxID=1824 RepID=UPI001E431F4D|nr:hypothetical protein [Nocardia asteroides]UGT53964.1 hypothetical protein LTT85_25375 [Nocardia asteroides]
MTDPTGSVTVELTADGSITAIRLSDIGHRMKPAMLAELIMSLHTAGLAHAQKAIEAALSADEAPAMPAPETGDSPVTPTLDVDAADEPETAESPTFSSPTPPLPTAAPSPPPWPAHSNSIVEPRACDQLTVAPAHASGNTPHDRTSSRPQHASPVPNSTQPCPDDTADDDEYFRNLSVFEYDDHIPRS